MFCDLRGLFEYGAFNIDITCKMYATLFGDDDADSEAYCASIIRELENIIFSYGTLNEEHPLLPSSNGEQNEHDNIAVNPDYHSRIVFPIAYDVRKPLDTSLSNTDILSEILDSCTSEHRSISSDLLAINKDKVRDIPSLVDNVRANERDDLNSASAMRTSCSILSPVLMMTTEQIAQTTIYIPDEEHYVELLIATLVSVLSVFGDDIRTSDSSKNMIERRIRANIDSMITIGNETLDPQKMTVDEILALISNSVPNNEREHSIVIDNEFDGRQYEVTENVNIDYSNPDHRIIDAIASFCERLYIDYRIERSVR